MSNNFVGKNLVWIWLAVYSTSHSIVRSYIVVFSCQVALTRELKTVSLIHPTHIQQVELERWAELGRQPDHQHVIPLVRQPQCSQPSYMKGQCSKGQDRSFLYFSVRLTFNDQNNLKVVKWANNVIKAWE